MHIQQDMQYRAARSTRLLNNHIKDQFGQQKPVVLFGFNVEPSASTGYNSTVKIGPGAILTHNGQKVFAYDASVAEVDAGNLSTANGSAQMYVVYMKHDYVADTSINNPEFKIKLIKDWLPRDTAPVKDIREINIITGGTTENSATLEHSTFSMTGEGYGVGGFDALVAGDASPILGYNEIPIAKIIVNVDVQGISIGLCNSTSWNNGVAVYQYKNPFEQLADYLGVNYFEPANTDDNGNVTTNERWFDTSVETVGNNPFNTYSLVGSASAGGTITATHDYNKAGYFDTTNEDRLPTGQPLFGFFETAAGDASRYRYASFLDDKHSFKWNMQRLSEILRAVESMVGSHPEYGLTRTLENKAPKDIATDVATNAIRCDYSVNDSECFVVKSGSVGWYKPDIGDGTAWAGAHDYDGKGTTSLGDNHHTAISMLDKAIAYLWKNRLGLDGATDTTGINKGALRVFSLSASSLSFDREHWNVTSISGDVGQYSTLKSAMQNMVDNKLHRHDGYADGWIHFGTDTTSTQPFSKVSKDFYDANSYGIWFDASQYAASSLSPIHISSQAFVTKATTYDPGLLTTMSFGSVEFAGASVSQFSVLYPDTMTLAVITPNGATNFSCISSSEFNRSTKTGYEFLNLSTRKMYDVSVLSDQIIPYPVNGEGFTITYTSELLNSVNPGSFIGTITGTVLRSNNTGAKTVSYLMLNDPMQIYPSETIVGPGGFSTGLQYNSRFVTPWNLLAITKYDKNTQNLGSPAMSIGIATITFASSVFRPGGTSISIGNSTSYNTYESLRDYTDYSGNVNVVDSKSGIVSNKFVSDMLTNSPSNRSVMPYHFNDWITIDDGDPTVLARNYNAQTGDIIGERIRLRGKTIIIECDELQLKSAQIKVPNGSTLDVSGLLKLESTGTIDATETGSQILYAGNLIDSGQKTMFDVDSIYTYGVQGPAKGGLYNEENITTYTVAPIFYSNPSAIANTSKAAYEGGPNFDSTAVWNVIAPAKSTRVTGFQKFGRSYETTIYSPVLTPSPITIDKLGAGTRITFFKLSGEITILREPQSFDFASSRNSIFSMLNLGGYTADKLGIKLAIAGVDLIYTATINSKTEKTFIDIYMGNYLSTTYSLASSYNLSEMNSLNAYFASYNWAGNDASIISFCKPSTGSPSQYTDVVLTGLKITYAVDLV